MDKSLLKSKDSNEIHILSLVAKLATKFTINNFLFGNSNVKVVGNFGYSSNHMKSSLNKFFI